MSLWAFVCSVHLWFSVRKRTHPHEKENAPSMWERTLEIRWGVFSLTEPTELTEPFCARFEPTEGLRHTENTEAFQLTLAVTLCEIGWLNVSVKLCVFCSSVLFCEKKNAPTLWDIAYEICWGGLSLTELTDLTEPFCALFRTHRTPPAYRYHRTL